MNMKESDKPIPQFSLNLPLSPQNIQKRLKCSFLSVAANEK